MADDPIQGGPPPPSSSSSGGSKYIGVPDDYTVQGMMHPQEEMGDIRFRRNTSYPYDITPRYKDGDEYIPANLPSTEIWALQQALAKVGLLNSTFTRNTWDSATRNAYRELLGLANATGLTWDKTLQELLATSGGKDGAGGSRYTVDENGNVVLSSEGDEVPPLITKTTDPAALRSTFRRAVIEMLGEGWSTAEINKMVAAYNQVEIAKQTEAHNMQYGLEGQGQEGDNMVAMPTPEEFIAQQVEAKDPAKKQEYEALGFVGDFMQMATQPAWGA